MAKLKVSSPASIKKVSVKGRISLSIPSRLKSISSKIFKKSNYNKVPAVGFGVVINGNIYTHVDGLRKYGSKMNIQEDDMFALGSIGKPLTGYLFASYAQKSIRLRKSGFYTTINDIYPDLIKTFQNNSKKGIGPDYSNFYAKVTVGQMMAHVSGFDYMPSYNWYNHQHNDLLKQVRGQNSIIDFLPADLIAKRKYYTELALSDRPYGGWDLRTNNNNQIKLLENINNNLTGTCTLFKYSGGCIAVASMMEKVSGKSWEDLITAQVFNPLKISKYRFLGTSKNNNFGLPNGNHQHIVRNNKIESYDISPADTSQIGYTHRPAGVPAMSMEDFGKWIRAVIDLYKSRENGIESLRKIKKEYFTPVATSGFTMGGWVSSDGKRLWHNGSNGYNYSLAVLQVDQNYGYYVFTNIDSNESRALVDELSQELSDLCKDSM